MHVGEPRLGESLLFMEKGRDFVTSTYIQEERPDKRIVEQYPTGLRGMRRLPTMGRANVRNNGMDTGSR